MRIISGDNKGRRLKTPSDGSVRPTSDKVKEAVFSILSCKISGSRVLDLFAGTGSLGLEAISRGADSCVFCDSSRKSSALIRNNITLCGAWEKAEIITGDFRNALSGHDEKYDIIFLDPPYGKGYVEKTIREISENRCLVCDGVIVAEHSRDELLPENISEFTKIKEKKYGSVYLSLFG